MVVRNAHQYGINKRHTQWREVVRSDHKGRSDHKTGGQKSPPTYKDNKKERPVVRSDHQKYKDTAPHVMTNLPDCPNPDCHLKAPSQNIDIEKGGCNFCKPSEVE